MRVIVTRPLAQAGPLADRIRALGHEVVLCPLIEIVPIADGPVALDGYDWVVVTSANGADELARRRSGPLPRVAAIGPGTKEALARHGIPTDLVPEVSTQEGLLAEFPEAPGRVLVVGARASRRLLVGALGADFRALYDTRPLRPAEPPTGDVAVLASGSAARAYAAAGLGVPVVTIGPQTTAAAERAGLRIVAEASTHDLDGLVAAVRDAAAAAP